jgi:putative tricarboxylic transport membrane protein
VILNLPLIPLRVTVLRVPSAILHAAILGFCALGAYSLKGSAFDVGLMTVLGTLGYLQKKLDIPLAPNILTMTVGPLMESALRQSLEISGGRYPIFLSRPISAALLACAAVVLVTLTLDVLARVKARDSEA